MKTMQALVAGAVLMAGAAHETFAQTVQPAAPATQPLRAGFNLPLRGETRYLPREVILDVPAGVPIRTQDAIAARHNMTRLETRTFRLTGRTLHRWRLDAGGTVVSMIRGLSREPMIAGAQPNYLYELTFAGF